MHEYMTQSLTWDTVGSRNDRNDVTTTSSTIAAHVQGYKGYIRAQAEAKNAPRYEVWTDAAIVAGGYLTIDGEKLVIQRTEVCRDLTGRVTHRRGWA
jgi:hypothetical protein